MNLRHHRLRDQRIAQLTAKPALTPMEHGELSWLQVQRDRLWRELPRRIAHQRRNLNTLASYADEIGLGPC